jgi:hypothetical protein
VADQKSDSQKYVSFKQLIDDIEATEAVLFHDQYNEAYIAVGGNGAKIIKLKSDEFKQWLSGTSWKKYKQAPSPNTTAKIIQTLMGKARFDGPQYRLEVRCALADDGIWYDCGKGNGVHITAKGWKYTDELPITFRRFQHQQIQVEPKKGGSLETLASFVNIEDELEKLLFIVYVVAAFIPGFPHPLLILTGPQGAGKSTPMRVIKELVDPSAIKGVSAPTDAAGFAQLAHHHAFMFFDNLSAMPNWFSDALARVSTGDGFSKRALYTDDDDIVYSLQRTVALNGINQVVHKADLLDRAILLSLKRIDPSVRMPEEEFWSEFEARRPALLGAIFEAVSGALAIHPTVNLDTLPRMADFTRWGYAIAEAAGFGGDKFIEAYSTNIDKQNEEAIDSSPVAQAVIALMNALPIWEGPASQLLAELNRQNFSNDLTKSILWPKDPQWLTKRINEVQPNLSSLGIEVERYATKDGRITKITNNTVDSVIADEDIPDFDDGKTVETVDPEQSTLL